MCDALKETIGGCFGSTKSFFTNKNNHLFSYFKSSQGVNKTLKFGASFFGSMWRIAEVAGCNARAVQGLKKTEELMDEAGGVASFFGAFTGDIPDCYNHGKNTVSLLFTREEVALVNKEPSKLGYNEKAITTREKIVAFVANFFKFGEKGAKVANSLVCNPISKIKKYFVDVDGKSLIHMSETTKKIGNTAPIFGMIDHFSGFVGESAQLGFEYMAYNRAKGIDPKATAANFLSKAFQSSLSIVSKSLDIIQDSARLIAKSCNASVPAWFSCSFSLVNAGLGCYSTWLKTTPKPE